MSPWMREYEDNEDAEDSIGEAHGEWAGGSRWPSMRRRPVGARARAGRSAAVAPLLGSVILLGSAAAFVGCEDDGGVDEAVEEIEDEVGDAKQEIEDEIDDRT